MSRRGSIFDDVMRMPWPVGVVAALIVFVVLQFYLSVEPQGIGGQAARIPIKMIGYFFSIMFLLAAFLSFLSQVIRAKRFGKMHSLADIRGLTWRQFESFTAEAYKRQGYTAIETAEGADNGVDLVLYKDGEKTYVQCKHWKSSSVGVEKIRELLGSMTAGGAHNGIFVASGYYTQPAKEFAQDCGITLVDGDGLVTLIGGIVVEQSDLVPTSQAEIDVTCPLCNEPMVKRVAGKGPNKGNAFWGCSKYPQCRGIRQG